MSGAAPSDAGRPSDFRPRRWAVAPGAWLIGMLVASLLIHGAVVVGASDARFGFVDPEAFDRSPRLVRVKRAARDTVLRPGESLDVMGSSTSEDSVAVEAEALDTLLEEVLAPEPVSPTVALGAELDLRPIDETRPTSEAGPNRLTLPAFEIDPGLLATLPDAGPAEARVQEDSGLVGRAGELDADAMNDALVDALLRQSVGSSVREANAGRGAGAGGSEGEAGAGGTALGLTTAASRVLDARPGGGAAPSTRFDDARPTPSAVGLGPAIDFTTLALDSTKSLEVPERLDDDFAYALTVFDDLGRPQEPDYFEIDITPRESLRKLATLPKDLVFLVDVSSSMPQAWVEQIALGVEQSFASLNPGDRFNVVMFNDTVRFLNERPVEATPARLAEARSFVRDARSKGYTDVNAALRQLLRRDVEPGRVYTLILISDGRPTLGVVDARQLINLITRENDRVAGIYCVGAAPQRQLDRRLLDFLAYRNNGYSVYQTQRDAVAGTIRDLTSQLRYPLISNVRLRVAGEHVSEVHPDRLPTIHQGQRFSVFGRHTQARPFTVQITGSAQDGQAVGFTFSQSPQRALQGNRQLARGWAFWKLHDLYSSLLEQGEQASLVDQVRGLRERYDLQTLY